MSIHARYTGDRVNPVVIRGIFHDHGGAVDKELNRASLLVLNRARTLVGVQSGRILASLRREEGEGPRGRYVDVTAGIPGITTYLGYHHDGTVAHTIRPRRRKALRFISGGRVVFAKRVRHPGTEGTHFLTRALDALH